MPRLTEDNPKFWLKLWKLERINWKPAHKQMALQPEVIATEILSIWAACPDIKRIHITRSQQIQLLKAMIRSEYREVRVPCSDVLDRRPSIGWTHETHGVPSSHSIYIRYNHKKDRFYFVAESLDYPLDHLPQIVVIDDLEE